MSQYDTFNTARYELCLPRLDWKVHIQLHYRLACLSEMFQEVNSYSETQVFL
jgi:hypothetical protein